MTDYEQAMSVQPISLGLEELHIVISRAADTIGSETVQKFLGRFA
jgi:hypothetical protein